MRSFTLLFLSVLIYSCSFDSSVDNKSVGFELLNMDSTTRPQDDLFQFANGGWIARTQIPEDRGNWNSFSELSEHNYSILLDVLKAANKNPKYVEGTDQRKVADFYSVGMDSLLAEKVGADALKPQLSRIAAVNNLKALQEYLVEDVLAGGDAFFSLYVGVDKKNSQQNFIYISTGGLGLPERDYYLKTDSKSLETRAKYLDHIASMFRLTGETEDEAERDAEKVLSIETRLARAMLSKEDRRNPQKVYNKRSVQQLGYSIALINWSEFFDKMDVEVDSVIVTEPEFLKECQRIFESGRWSDMGAYLKWRAIDKAAPYLNYDFVKEDFDFNSHYLRGTDRLRPRWKRVLAATNNNLGEAIGQLYVDRAFPPEAKRKAMEMVENIKLAMADRIKQLDWMSDSTKVMALNKLKNIQVKIGYPDEWKSYAGLLVENSPERSSYYQNIVNASKWRTRQELNKLGKPVDKKEWRMTPQTVNAYYNSGFNEIVFPAGILQPPFYNYLADEAVNYGGIGAVIGHEISHGFDDRGSQFDADGNLKNWWGEEDLKKFKNKGSLLAEQFDQYEPLPGVHVQGTFTLGENIGDLGGLNIAYEGLQRFLRENGNPGLIDGFTPEQRFFISWATIWRSKEKDESLRTQVNTDSHAPNRFRANGPVSNTKAFYDAFGLKEGDKLYRQEADRILIW